MKHLFIVLMVVLVVLFGSAGVLADGPQPELPIQTPTIGPTVEPTAPVFEWPEQLPETAQEGLQVLAGFVTFISSLLAMYATSWIRNLPILNDGEKSKISGLGADPVAAVMALAIGFILAYGAYVANFLDANGFWQVIIYVFPLLWGMHKAKKFSDVGKLVPILLGYVKK